PPGPTPAPTPPTALRPPTTIRSPTTIRPPQAPAPQGVRADSVALDASSPAGRRSVSQRELLPLLRELEAAPPGRVALGRLRIERRIRVIEVREEDARPPLAHQRLEEIHRFRDERMADRGDLAARQLAGGVERPVEQRDVDAVEDLRQRLRPGGPAVGVGDVE